MTEIQLLSTAIAVKLCPSASVVLLLSCLEMRGLDPSGFAPSAQACLERRGLGSMVSHGTGEPQGLGRHGTKSLEKHDANRSAPGAAGSGRGSGGQADSPEADMNATAKRQRRQDTLKAMEIAEEQKKS